MSLSPSLGASQVVLVVKNLTASVADSRDVGSIPGSGRSPGEGNGNLPQYSCLGNPMDRGAWWAIVLGVAKSQTRLKWLNNKQIQDSMPNHEWWWALWGAKRPQDVSGGHQWVHPPRALLLITSVYCHYSALLCPLIKFGLHLLTAHRY